DDRPAGSREPHARALRARVEPFGRQEDTGLRELLVVFAHVGEELLALHDLRFRVLVGLHEDHESHGVSPFISSPISSPRLPPPTSCWPYPSRTLPRGPCPCSRRGRRLGRRTCCARTCSTSRRCARLRA